MVSDGSRSPRSWITRLAPRQEVTIGDARSPRLLVDDAVARVGEGPVRWAIEVARAVSTRILDAVPVLGGSPAAFAVLARGNEATTLRAVVALHEEAPSPTPASEATLEGIREYVRRAIPLERVLSGVRAGHAATTEAFLGACAELVAPSVLAAEMTAVTRELFHYVDETAEAMIHEYLAEHEVWRAGAAASRANTVRAVLADDHVGDHDEASRALGYDLGRTHLAAVLWLESPDAATALKAAADALFRARGATSTLTVPVASNELWAWGVVHGDRALVSHGAPDPPGGDIAAALGTPAPGVTGFRRSHLEAERARRLERLRREAAQPPRRITHYDDVATVALLGTDLVAAGEFARRELGALGDSTEAMSALRTTLRLYLDAERSLVSVSRDLHVARGTVTYRVKRAQELLGHDLDERRFALRAALELVEELGDAVLSPPPPTPRA